MMNPTRLLMAMGILLYGSVLGCGNQLPATVSGTITLDGQPLTGVAGEVMFHPSGGGAMAMASLGSDGSYSINTGSTKGLDPGEYSVTVSVVRTAPEPDGGYQSAPGQTLISASRYGDKDKSDLKATVEPGKNVFDYDLGSE